MIKKTIKYVDYNGTEREEEFFFHLTKPELIELEVSEHGGLEKMIREIIRSEDNKKIVEIFKNVLLLAYGEKSPDGRRFIKSPELSEAFSQTEAYAELFMSLAENEEEAAAFFNNLMPKDQPKVAALPPNV